MDKMKDVWSSELEEAIDKIKNNKNIYTIGRVIKVNEYIVEVSGLNDVAFYESINIANKATGYVMSVMPNKIIVALVSVK